jgi:hypothetical protein
MAPLRFKNRKDLVENPEKKEGHGPDEKGAQETFFESL